MDLHTPGTAIARLQDDIVVHLRAIQNEIQDRIYINPEEAKDKLTKMETGIINNAKVHLYDMLRVALQYHK